MQLLSGRAGPDTTRYQALEPLVGSNWAYKTRESHHARTPSHINRRLVRNLASCVCTIVEAILDPHAVQSQRSMTRNQSGGAKGGIGNLMPFVLLQQLRVFPTAPAMHTKFSRIRHAAASTDAGSRAHIGTSVCLCTV